MEDFFANFMIAIFGTSHIDAGWLKFSDDTALTYVRGIWAYVGMFGMALTLVYFIIEMNTKLALEGANNMTMKSFMSPFLKLGFAVAILYNGGHIVGALMNTNNAMVDKADKILMDSSYSGDPVDTDGDGVPDTSQNAYDKMVEAFKDFNIFEKVIIILVVILVYLVALVLQLVWVYKAMLYKLEFLWKVGSTPFALADIYSGNHSNAIRWLKGFLGLSIYAMAIIMMPALATALSVDTSSIAPDPTATIDIWGLLKTLLVSLLAPFAALGVMGTIKQVCKEALG